MKKKIDAVPVKAIKNSILIEKCINLPEFYVKH